MQRATIISAVRNGRPVVRGLYGGNAEIGQAFVDRLLVSHVRGDEIVKEVSMAKWWASDLQRRVSAECLQLFGGYGFMDEYPISQDYADAAVQTIYAGTNEIMKVIIARRMGLG